MPETSALSSFATRAPRLVFAARILWIAIRIILVIWFGERGAFFVYQGY